jgi:nucleolar GTP-binding protein
MFKIPSIMMADELMDFAFHRATKAQKPASIKSRIAREKVLAIAKLQTIQDTLTDKLKKYVKSFPSLDNIHPFYSQLIDVLVGNDRLKKALGAINWAKRKVTGVCTTNLRRIKAAKSLPEIHTSRNETYGRVSSVLKQVNKELMLLSSARETLRKLPEIDPAAPTVVIGGYPNVGKSMLVEKLSSAKPDIASYPFTTKDLLVGHIEHDYTQYQVIDTPGLLDSDPSDKKTIERQAVMALEHLADMMIFVLDPSEYCGYPLSQQLSLMERLKDQFPNLDMIVVENKSDLVRLKTDRMKISALKGVGIDDLKNKILSEITTRQELAE